MQYDSILRLFVLPKSNTPHTLVVISLDPPIRKGQTHYYHILVQFPSDEERQVELEISDEALAAKNEKVRPRSYNLQCYEEKCLCLAKYQSIYNCVSLSCNLLPTSESLVDERAIQHLVDQ